MDRHEERQAAKNAAMMKAFGNRLKAARILEGYETAQDFAAAAKIHAHTYRKYERGDSFPRIVDLVDIALRLGQSLDTLIAGIPKRAKAPDPGDEP